MQQVRITAIDPDYRFEVAEVPEPAPEKGQVLVRVATSGINPADWKMAGADFAPLPHAPGLDVAGTVAAVGEGVTGFSAGDRVAGQAPMGAGALSPYAITRARTTAAIPPEVGFDNAATLVTSGQAAWAALIEEAELAPGQSVLIHGGGGAVGSFAVQIARHAGARVIATASPRHHDLLRELGADEIIDYTATPFEQAVRDVDVVLDTIGGDTFLRSIDALRDGGTMVTIAWFDAPPRAAIEDRHLRVRQLSMRPNGERLSTLLRLVASGAIQPVIGTRVPLAGAIDAMRQSMRGHNRGNVVVTVP